MKTKGNTYFFFYKRSFEEPRFMVKKTPEFLHDLQKLTQKFPNYFAKKKKAETLTLKKTIKSFKNIELSLKTVQN